MSDDDILIERLIELAGCYRAMLTRECTWYIAANKLRAEELEAEIKERWPERCYPPERPSSRR